METARQRQRKRRGGRHVRGQRERSLQEEEEEEKENIFKWGVFWSIFLKVKEHESVYQRGK